MTTIIDGKALKNKILEELKLKVALLEEKPCLAVIIVGEDPASKIYVNSKKKTALEVGFNSVVLELPSGVSETELLKKIEELNNNPNINAILVQLPLPEHINSKKIIESIDTKKDVDCFHPYNAGKIATNSDPYIFPCTPKGIISLIEEYKIPIESQNVVIIGRSNIVGKPLAQMFTNLNATVTLCHSKTKNLKAITKTADILVSAVGKAKLITKEMVKEGAAIFDVGMNRIETSQGKKLTGDVDFENVKDCVSYITPVPGGVGPMTICSLMVNTYDLFNLQKRV